MQQIVFATNMSSKGCFSLCVAWIRNILHCCSTTGLLYISFSVSKISVSSVSCLKLFTGKTWRNSNFWVPLCYVFELFGREGGVVQGGGGRWSKVGVPHKGNRWQRSRFILCSSELTVLLCVLWESACTCVFQLSLVSLSPANCLSVLSCLWLWSSQQEWNRTGPRKLTIRKTQSKGIVFGEFFPPSWDARIMRNKLALLEWQQADLHRRGWVILKLLRLLSFLWSVQSFYVHVKLLWEILVNRKVLSLWCSFFLSWAVFYLSVNVHACWCVHRHVCCAFMMCCLVCGSSVESTQLLFFSQGMSCSVLIICSDISHVQK